MLSRFSVILEEDVIENLGISAEISEQKSPVHQQHKLSGTEANGDSLDKRVHEDLSSNNLREDREMESVDENGSVQVDRGMVSRPQKLVSLSDHHHLPEHYPLSSSNSPSTAHPPPNNLLLRTTISKSASVSPSSSLPPLLGVASYSSPTGINTALSQCIASTGESSYDLSAVDSGVSLFVPQVQPHSTPDRDLLMQHALESKDGRHDCSFTSLRPTQQAGADEPASSPSNANNNTLNQNMLQSKIQALMLSNELLKTSLDDAKRQVSSLQATVISQKEEIAVKESQISTINGRVTALLRGMESTDSSNMQYKELYHKSVQQNAILQGQLNKFNRMSSSIQAFLKVYEGMSKRLLNNKELIDLWKNDMISRERTCLEKVKDVCLLKSAHQEVIKDCHRLRQSNEELSETNSTLVSELAGSLVRVAITSAKHRLVSVEAIRMKETLVAQNRELQGKLAHLLDSFKRAKDEFQESAEFSDMERQMLLETNVELEQEVKTLKGELEEGEEEFKKLVDYIKQYQSESTEKTTTLKTNLEKANREIEQLDKLIEQVKLVMADNISCIKQSKPLLTLLQLLNGEESTS